jgi:hypothetical protein
MATNPPPMSFRCAGFPSRSAVYVSPDAVAPIPSKNFFASVTGMTATIGGCSAPMLSVSPTNAAATEPSGFMPGSASSMPIGLSLRACLSGGSLSPIPSRSPFSSLTLRMEKTTSASLGRRSIAAGRPANAGRAIVRGIENAAIDRARRDVLRAMNVASWVGGRHPPVVTTLSLRSLGVPDPEPATRTAHPRRGGARSLYGNVLRSISAAGQTDQKKAPVAASRVGCG